MRRDHSRGYTVTRTAVRFVFYSTVVLTLIYLTAVAGGPPQ